MNSRSVTKKSVIIVAGTACFTVAVLTFAQVQTQTTKTSGATTRQVTIESGEVVAVEGNDLFVKMSDGTLRDFPNIPASATVDVDGKQLSVSQLQPGMKLQRATVTATTPQVVTTVETVTGKVWHVQPPSMVILTLENNENQQFKIPKGQKFTVNGTETDAWGLKKGMVVSATRVTETPLTSVSQSQHVTGTLPAGQPVLIVKGGPTPAPGAEGSVATSHEAGTTTTASAELPKTASGWPLVGILGLLFISASFGLALLRRNMGF
jgi:LPXTG-motif cell wall-anchored protein